MSSTSKVGSSAFIFLHFFSVYLFSENSILFDLIFSFGFNAWRYLIFLCYLTLVSCTSLYVHVSHALLLEIKKLDTSSSRASQGRKIQAGQDYKPKKEFAHRMCARRPTSRMPKQSFFRAPVSHSVCPRRFGGGWVCFSGVSVVVMWYVMSCAGCEVRWSDGVGCEVTWGEVMM